MKNQRINEIDLLRFLAALAVVFFHLAFRGYAADGLTAMSYPLLAPVAKYGYLGVNLFFTISGFVILMTVANGSISKFMISRFVRLYPAYWVCCTITFLAIMAVGKPQFSASIVQYLINMTMLNGFVNMASIDGAYWSLLIEMKFYILVGILLAIKKIHKIEIFVFAWLIASTFLTIGRIGIFNFILFPEYSTYFIAGAIYFKIWSEGVSQARLWILCGSWLLAICQSIKSLPEFEQHYSTSLNYYLVTAIITGFFFIMFLVATRNTGTIGNRSWVLVGAITYPLYLIHQNLGFIVFNIAYPRLDRHIVFWGTLMLTIAIAYAVNRWIEQRFTPPMKNTLNRLFNRVYRPAIES
jgi:peptidoglycan/LPS O-acetylase OafA/YrhL